MSLRILTSGTYQGKESKMEELKRLAEIRDSKLKKLFVSLIILKMRRTGQSLEEGVLLNELMG